MRSEQRHEKHAAKVEQRAHKAASPTLRRRTVLCYASGHLTETKLAVTVLASALCQACPETAKAGFFVFRRMATSASRTSEAVSPTAASTTATVSAV